MYSTQGQRAFQYSEHLLPFSRITVSVLRGRLSRLWKNSQVHHGSNLEDKKPSLLSDRLFKLIFFSPYPCNSASLMEIMTFLLAARQSVRLIMREGWMFLLTQPLSAISPNPFVLPRHRCYLSRWVRGTSFQVKPLLMQPLSGLVAFQRTQVINYIFTCNNHLADLTPATMCSATDILKPNAF